MADIDRDEIKKSPMPTGVLLINMGGPGNPEEIEPYLFRLFNDPMVVPLPLGKWLQKPFARIISSLRKSKSRALYNEIGGKSPLLDITMQQARNLETVLIEQDIQADVRIAMRYSAPFIPEALDYFARKKIRRLVVLPLYPQYCRATTGTAVNEIRNWEIKHNPAFRITVIDQFHEWQDYINAQADMVKQYVPDTGGTAGKPALIFTAHSIPMRLVEYGDPYVKQTERTVQKVMELIGPGYLYKLAYQSRSSGPVRWVGPDIRSAIRLSAGMHVNHLTFVPLSFVAENLETLQEIDKVYIPLARSLGVPNVNRVPCLNAEPPFIKSLGSLVKNHLRGIPNP